MASPAIDRKGNIGIGYSFGGTPNFPGQRFAARLANDPLGQLTLRETLLVEGEAAQNVIRWEDYTQTAMIRATTARSGTSATTSRKTP